MTSGKTVLGEALSQMLDCPHLNIDILKWDYFTYFGYDDFKAKVEYNRDGIRGLHNYYKEFELKTLKRVFSKYSACCLHWW
jgi:hypothetical protein